MIKFLLLLLIVFLFVRTVGKRFFPGVLSDASKQRFKRAGNKDVVDDLVKDPECGTYVSVAEAVKIVKNGKTVYFCSEACKDAYQSKH